MFGNEDLSCFVRVGLSYFQVGGLLFLVWGTIIQAAGKSFIRRFKLFFICFGLAPIIKFLTPGCPDGQYVIEIVALLAGVGFLFVVFGQQDESQEKSK